MAERPQPLSPNARASAMAARFGMTREAVEELLHKTHSEYPSAIQPAAEPTANIPIERVAQELRGVHELTTPPPTTLPTTKPLSGGFIAAIFVVLLIALGIAMSFRQGCFQRRTGKQSAKSVDTIQTMMGSAARQASSPPLPATNVAPGEIPPEALVVPREEPPGTSGPNSNSGITTEEQALPADHLGQQKPTLVTSSNFDAEEALAELRAEGKSHAHLKAVRVGGGVRYRVFSK